MAERTRGLECIACSHVATYHTAEDFDECPQCGSEETFAVWVEDCPVPEDEQCLDDNHHHGIDKHTIEVAD